MTLGVESTEREDYGNQTATIEDQSSRALKGANLAKPCPMAPPIARGHLFLKEAD